MMALITGSCGFVGTHLTNELSQNGYSVHGIDLIESESTTVVDLLDREAVRSVINDIQPDVLFHLAAQASVPLSWKEPQRTYEVNVIGAINLLEAVHAERGKCRIVIVGSADQYGAIGTSNAISETASLSPQNPYALSKKAQEEIALIYARSFSMNICITRSFNHCGPGQKSGFLVSDLCHGIVEVERRKAEYLKVGNMEAVRDFTDVRDIVMAYRLIGERGTGGEIYNVGTGTGRNVKDVLDTLLSLANREIPVKPDPERMRISDTPVLICDNAKLRAHTVWSPTIPFEQTLKDALEYYRSIDE